MPQTIDMRPTLAAPDDDPYLWLEDVDGERALAWVEAQNQRTLAQFATGRYAADRETLAAIFDRPDNLPLIARRGARVFNFWKDAAHPRGLWRATSLDSYRGETPDWQTLLDLDALAAREGEDWTWSGAVTLPPDHSRALLMLSRGGADAVALREFNLVTLAFVADGFTLPEAKSSAVWLDDDTLLLSSALGEGMATHSGYARTVRLWRRGADPLTAPVIFATDPRHMAVSADLDRDSDEGRVWFIERLGFFDETLWLGDHNGPGFAWISRPARRRPGTAAGSRSSGGPYGKSAAKPIRPIPCSAYRWQPFLAATAASPSFSSRPSGAPCSSFSGAAIG